MKKEEDKKEKPLIDLPDGFPQALGETVIVYQGVFDNEMVKTESGIYLPEVGTGAQGEAAKGFGWIMGVGPDVNKTVWDTHTKEKRVVGPGDYIQFNHYADSGVMYMGRFYLVFHQVEIRTYFPEKAVPMSQKSPDRRRGAVEKGVN